MYQCLNLDDATGRNALKLIKVVEKVSQTEVKKSGFVIYGDVPGTVLL